eukprot:1067034_1
MRSIPKWGEVLAAYLTGTTYGHVLHAAPISIGLQSQEVPMVTTSKQINLQNVQMIQQQQAYLLCTIITSLYNVDVSPTGAPTKEPSTGPTGVPSTAPTASTDVPSTIPKTTPTGHPSTSPSKMPTHGPTNVPSTSPTDVPSTSPTRSPSANPTTTTSPTHIPSTSPSANPTTTTTLEPITTYSSDSDDADDMESVSWSDSGDINSAFLGHQQKDDDSLTNNADIPYKVEIDLSLTALCIVIAICVSITAIFWSYQCRGQKSKSSNASQNDVEVNN